MDFIASFAPDSHMPIGTTALRMVVAIVFGAIIGLEREWRDRPAGLRTHMLTALAACLFTVLTEEIMHTDAFQIESMASDPIRVIEAVTGGVAFLAAGAIIQGRGSVRGLTTGAGMWLAGALGVAAGLGQFMIGGLAAILALAVLLLVGQFQKPEPAPARTEPKPAAD